MKAFLVLALLLLSVAAGAWRIPEFLHTSSLKRLSSSGQYTGITDQQFYDQLLAQLSGGPVSKPKCSSLSNPSAMDDDAFLAALLNGCEPDEEPPSQSSKPKCSNLSDPSAMGNDAFLAALQNGCEPDEEPPSQSSKPKCSSLSDPSALDNDAFLAALENGCEPDEEPPSQSSKPKCSSLSDPSALGNDAFLAALQSGCEPDEESPTPEPDATCERGEFRCTPYHRCLEQDIVSDSQGVFGLRIGLDQYQAESKFNTHSECPRFGDICCAHPLPATPEPVVTEAPYVPQCGQRHEEGLGARITDFKDNESQLGEFPWVAMVSQVHNIRGQDVQLYICSGSLVHPQMVLTAAHCVSHPKNERLVVRLGEWDLQHESELYPHVDISVDDVVVHPGFHPRLLRDDVALLLLAEPAPLQAHIDTLCLLTPHVNFDRAQCVTAGWGQDAMETGKYQTVLKRTELPQVPRAECQAALRTTRLRKYFRLDRSFTCAGGEAGQDACVGDGGAPLACRDPWRPDRWVQLGVVSWGVECGRPGVPGVYADVRRQVGWIGRMARLVEQRLQQQ